MAERCWSTSAAWETGCISDRSAERASYPGVKKTNIQQRSHQGEVGVGHGAWGERRLRDAAEVGHIDVTL